MEEGKTNMEEVKIKKTCRGKMPGRIAGKESGDKNFAKNHGGKRCREMTGKKSGKKSGEKISGKKTWRTNMAEKHIFFKNNGITIEF